MFKRSIIVVFCSDLVQIDNGTLSFIDLPLSGPKPNRTVATYTCDGGFTLDRNATRICDNGNWTGTVPVCIESNPLVCTDICYCMYGGV